MFKMVKTVFDARKNGSEGIINGQFLSTLIIGTLIAACGFLLSQGYFVLRDAQADFARKLDALHEKTDQNCIDDAIMKKDIQAIRVQIHRIKPECMEVK